MDLGKLFDIMHKQGRAVATILRHWQTYFRYIINNIFYIFVFEADYQGYHSPAQETPCRRLL